MSTVYVFRGHGKMTPGDAEAFRERGWSVRKHKHGLALTGAVNKAVLERLNKAGFWWEVVGKRLHNPVVGEASGAACCIHHRDQFKSMPKVRAAKKATKKAPKKNPDMKAAKKKAAKKAKAWFSNPELETKPRIVKRTLPNSFVEVGTVAAIEYESDKFDGESRLYRHDVTKKRKLLISVDGSTMIVQPPFRITKRGIEG